MKSKRVLSYSLMHLLSFVCCVPFFADGDSVIEMAYRCHPRPRCITHSSSSPLSPLSPSVFNFFMGSVRLLLCKRISIQFRQYIWCWRNSDFDSSSTCLPEAPLIISRHFMIFASNFEWFSSVADCRPRHRVRKKVERQRRWLIVTVAFE